MIDLPAGRIRPLSTDLNQCFQTLHLSIFFIYKIYIHICTFEMLTHSKGTSHFGHQSITTYQAIHSLPVWVIRMPATTKKRVCKLQA